MEISAADVMKLRKATGAGMMDCKTALADAEGDFNRAIDIIREKGKLVASKRADRAANEGVVLAKVNESKKSGALLVLNCETDFVAKNESFVAFAQKILDTAIANNTTNLDAVKALVLDGRTVEDHIIEQTGIIGEKLDLPYFAKLDAETVVAYIHPGNKLSTLVGFNKPDVEVQVTKDIAMQVAAMNPVAVDKDDVPAETVAKELEIAKEKFRQEGKAEAMLDKISQGALVKFFKENTLLNQAFIKENKQTVAEFLKSTDKGLTVTAFYRYNLAD
ncbi:MAG: translation elongation factor Ts [Bacteroidota bacterium]|nr:translation elongation factor Ts [Bacteroidota bacterium]